MANYARAAVSEIMLERPGIQHVQVVFSNGESGRAYVITQLTAPVEVADEVLCNTTAVDLDLGTGSWHFVAVNLTKGAFSTPSGGHIMKLRYTPVQTDTGSAEEHLEVLPDRIDGAVVVACTLHSQVPLVVLGALQRRPKTRIAYVMTDGAGLPMAFSGLVAEMVTRGLLKAGTITAGHAFGGDREAVGVPSALALAQHDAGAELIVVGMGPGVVGTGHTLGTTALEAAPILDTTAALGGTPILCVRASSGDLRPRHRGLSHHSATVMDLVRSPVWVPVPEALTDAVLPWRDRHRCVTRDAMSGAELLRMNGMKVTTMGRGPAEDALFFDTTAVAGIFAAEKLS